MQNAKGFFSFIKLTGNLFGSIIYIDGFAGPGIYKIFSEDGEKEEEVEGSPIIALKVVPPLYFQSEQEQCNQRTILRTRRIPLLRNYIKGQMKI